MQKQKGSIDQIQMNIPLVTSTSKKVILNVPDIANEGGLALSWENGGLGGEGGGRECVFTSHLLATQQEELNQRIIPSSCKMLSGKHYCDFSLLMTG